VVAIYVIICAIINIGQKSKQVKFLFYF